MIYSPSIADALSTTESLRLHSVLFAWRRILPMGSFRKMWHNVADAATGHMPWVIIANQIAG
ncbi:MAG: hypothetical protein COW18_03665 [Zetaproteobacteria bacterium CG12_big_fil_rev_8_21_14_0_65_54_13]|nr:MAG: hypothetical protein COW18_03665 [Zetaproteobacteria bacterium CG12_big_fil_rev_8_21_14_0_65_54_13]PIX54961.1 MAG: hypothetical protein COZ50_05145 [Zetaproteobacteria bacterium CG_4_10_14_3_um_filter_54_28]PJA27652.1 MAG: hypothetical protein CO188_12035 [Zetaproteobacteria bacterium CG_4_9_14_3_um_filter_54_145]